MISRTRAFGQCLKCWAIERRTEAVVARKRMKCQRCSRFFRSVTRWNNCPDCRASLERRREQEKALQNA